HRVDSLRCEGSDAIGAKRTCRERRQRVDLTKMTHCGPRVCSATHRRLATARREKKNQRAAASANFARRTPRHPRTLRSTTAAAMPALSKMDLQRAAA